MLALSFVICIRKDKCYLVLAQKEILQLDVDKQSLQQKLDQQAATALTEWKTMPGMTGVDLYRCMLQMRPNLTIILCTGFSNFISEEKAKAMGIKGFAMKPLSKKDLAATIRKLLD